MKQKQSIGRLISSINTSICVYIDLELKEYNIGCGQISYLRALSDQDGVSQETLTAQFGVNKATTARAISKLVKKGYVTRKRDEADNRAYKLYLTKKGKKMEPKIKSVLQQLTEALSIDLADDERASVIHLLEKMSQNILTENKKVRAASID